MFGGEQSEGSGGIRGSIRRLLESVNGFLATKLELISVELQEEKRRVLELLILAAAAMLSGVLALITITFTVVVYFWNTEYKMASMVIISILYIIIAIGLFVRLQRRANLSTKVFEATVEELKKDSEWVKRHL